MIDRLASPSFRHRLAGAMFADAAVEEHPSLRHRVLAFVDDRIAAMPAHLKLGVLATERFLGSVSPAASPAVLSRRIGRWESSRVPPVTQYVRLIRSLVLLSAHEFAEEREGATPW